ncbi:MAG: MFS transporter [bacterium]
MQKAEKFLVPSLIVFSYHFCFRMFFAFVPIHLNRIGVTQAEIGLLFSTIPFVLLALTVPLGYMSDRYSVRSLVSAGILLLATSIFLLRFAENSAVMLPLFIGIGAGTAVFRTNMNSLYLKILGISSRPLKLAVFNSLQQFGYGVGPLVGGYLLLGMDLRDIFVVSSATFIPFFILSFKLPHIKPERFSLADYAMDLRRWSVWCFLAIVFVFGLHFGVEDVCFTLFLKKNLGLTEITIGKVFLIIAAVLVVMTLICGWFGSKAAVPRSLLYFGLLFSGASNFLMLFVHNLLQLIGVKILHVTGDAMFLLFYQIALAELFPAARVGAPVGLAATITIAGTLTGSLMSGALPGFALPFGVVGILTMTMIPVAALFSLFLKRERSKLYS